MRSVLVAILFPLLVACSYSNSTPMGRTVADERTIRDVQRAIALLERSPTVTLTRIAQETSRQETSYVGIRLKQLDSEAFEFFCWLPCKDHEAFRSVAEVLPQVERIAQDWKEGRSVSETWHVRVASGVKSFQVRYFYVPGGGGASPILSRKPDHLYVRAS
jgi:hypothetical protein